MSKKFLPILYSNVLYKVGQNILDIKHSLIKIKNVKQVIPTALTMLQRDRGNVWLNIVQFTTTICPLDPELYAKLKEH